MKLCKISSIILLGFISLTFTSCRYPYTIVKRNSGYKLVRDFENAGERDCFASRQVFRRNYKQMDYPPYKGEVEVYKDEKGMDVKYESALIKLGANDSLYYHLFSSKIIQPQLIGCNSLSGHSILIHELTDLEKRHKKRFSLWVFQPGCLNPEVVLIEITNPDKNKDAPLYEFVENAKLTFVYHGWIIM